MTDWRVDNGKHTRGAVLTLKEYLAPSDKWDHEHCVCCWAKFVESAPGALSEGYTTKDNYHWICPQCFRDLKGEMEWTLASSSA
jgi:hypothetical protein